MYLQRMNARTARGFAPRMDELDEGLSTERITPDRRCFCSSCRACEAASGCEAVLKPELNA
ncbi:hypothetical protein C9I49_16705 [Pseudomonas prosekii]|uniref:Uncharacterized protein n=1 Tax=Pseudomonas prosekii TaxID=1148509 RepID=A0A2U2D6E0_9PSED|nr:hypothetical protein C9I49_16705 [Pseudomonas prosekii]